MKLFSSSLELRAVKAICQNGEASSLLLASLRENMFHTEPGKVAFNRILSMMRKDGDIPSYEVLTEDPIIPEAIRKTLSKFTKDPLRVSDVKKAVRSLTQYTQVRDLLRLSESIVNEVQGETVDTQKLLNTVADSLAKIRSGSEEAKMTRFGVGNNSTDMILEILESEGEEEIPTTFNVWDRVNNGIPKEAVMIIAATTGGWKSTMASNMCINLAKRGYRPAVWSGEMNEKQLTQRIMSNVSRIPLNKFGAPKKLMTAAEIKKAKKCMASFINEVKDAGGSYMIYNPVVVPNMTGLLYGLKPYQPDVIIVDYAALLDEGDSEDEWKLLSKAVRMAKRFSLANSIPVIILAQLDENLTLRYSKRMRDDADIMWAWVADDEAYETGIINVHQKKARQKDPFPFQLKVEAEFNIMRDLTDDEVDDADMPKEDDEGDKRRRGKEKTKPKTRVLKDISKASNLDDFNG